MNFCFRIKCEKGIYKYDKKEYTIIQITVVYPFIIHTYVYASFRQSRSVAREAPVPACSGNRETRETMHRRKK